MNEWLPETPATATPYCPGCEPARDPVAELLDVRWCASHNPTFRGEDDDSVVANSFLSGSSEVGGEDNRQWCRLVHRNAARSAERTTR